MYATDVELDIPVAESFPLTGAQAMIFGLFRIKGSFTDTELNDYYAANWEFQGWPAMRYDTPRKRRSDLTARGLVVSDGSTRPNRFGGQEKIWTVTA